jgi:hypothetical protein
MVAEIPFYFNHLRASAERPDGKMKITVGEVCRSFILTADRAYRAGYHARGSAR